MTGGSKRASAQVTPLLLTQAQAAELLQVSQAYLRNSDCPKVLLAGHGSKGKNLVRYKRDDLEAWTTSRRVSATGPQRRSA